MNRGTGAGGSETNHNGLEFESRTDNIPNLEKDGYKKVMMDEKNYFYAKEYPTKFVIFLKQFSLKKYLEKYENIKLKELYRPDEAYIIKEKESGKTTIKILEKKNQNVSGSVEEKIDAAPIKKMKYKRLLPNFKIEYAFCLSGYFKNKLDTSNLFQMTYTILNQDFDIPIFFGDDSDYFERLNEWIEN